jgi:diaminohydroxyphosphoribosylaminopyrimidine deaminase / 5-amino-6-(5-phosphoribosylamino)uracil reductase
VNDLELMRRAFGLAELGLGRTSPNPVVGAIVVDAEGTIVGDGHHERAGTPHAEVHALDAAGTRARGATLYCTLEPCGHTGRTGPCVERIVAAGISRVVAAIADPNPLVAGTGFEYLRAHGVRVDVGLGGDEAARLNASFFTFIRTGLPHVTAKAGVTLDGRIAAHRGVRTAITGRASRRATHLLRAEVDAIAVGSGTVITDDPWLTAREVYRERPLTRVVFDRRLRTPPAARLLRTLEAGPVLVLSTTACVASSPERAAALEAAGATLVALPDGAVATALAHLGSRGIMALLLEGGAALHAAAWDAGMIDRVLLFVSPDTAGERGLPLFDGRGPHLSALAGSRVEPVGGDIRIDIDVHRAH